MAVDIFFYVLSRNIFSRIDAICERVKGNKLESLIRFSGSVSSAVRCPERHGFWDSGICPDDHRAHAFRCSHIPFFFILSYLSNVCMVYGASTILCSYRVGTFGMPFTILTSIWRLWIYSTMEVCSLNFPRPLACTSYHIRISSTDVIPFR